MASAESEVTVLESGVMLMHREFAAILGDLSALLPRQETTTDEEGKEKTETLNPLMDLLRRKGVKALVPRLVRAVTGDIIPALSRAIMAIGAGMADLEARVEAMESHPFLQIAAMEDFNDPTKLDAFLSMVIEVVSEQINILDPEDERMERDEWIMKMCERMRLGLSLGMEDEGEDEDGSDDGEGDDGDDGEIEGGRNSDSGRVPSTQAAEAEKEERQAAGV